MAPHEIFKPHPESVRAARRFAAEALSGHVRSDQVILTVSELATNVVRHAKTDFSVRLSSDDDQVRIEVSDGSSLIPAVEDLADSKWGLRIVDAMSDRWGIESTEIGKTVWAEFANTQDGS